MVHWNGGVLARALSQKTTHLIVGANQSLVSPGCNLDPFIISGSMVGLTLVNILYLPSVHDGGSVRDFLKSVVPD